MAIQTPELNSVVAAYLRGKQMREESDQAAQAQENEVVAQKQRQQQLDTAQKALEDQVKRETERHQMETEQASLNKKLALHNLVTNVLTSRAQGKPTPDLQLDVPDQNVADTYTGMEKPPTTGSLPEFGVSGIDLSGSDPIEYAKKQADIDRISGAPALEAKQALAEAKAKAEADKLDTTNKFKLALQEANNNAKADAQAEKAQADFDRDIKVQQLRNAGSLAVANINAEAGKAKVAQNLVKLSTADQAKLDSIKDVRRNLLLAKKDLDETGYGFFRGPEGIFEAAGTAIAGENSDVNQRIKSNLANGYQSFVVAQQGKTLTKNEEAMIDALYPTGSHTKSARSARTNMEGLLQRLDAIEADVYSRYAGSKSGNAQPDAGSSGIKLLSVTPTGKP